MTELNLRGAKAVRFGDVDVQRVRVANVDLWAAPWSAGYEDGTHPWVEGLSASGSPIAVRSDVPVRSGARALLYADQNGNHAVRCTRTQEYKRGDVFSTWLQLRSQNGTQQARLGGLALANADTAGSFFGILIDMRNQDGPGTYSLQIRESVSASVNNGISTPGLVSPGVWFRVEAWITATAVQARLYDSANALVLSTQRVPTTLSLPTRINPGVYSYGGAVFDDYLVTPM
ncbi:hypothetical protein QE430_002457 [Microbacterium testaceum]|uniref:hypothetical protein n=1 Tax=Microbacterium testaceum TaxID=2033 RepID=UPI00278807F8|nr:hypothetical protein [Microbacterium testaceum]MDQ1174150.1 hypothetical protein [Microbacterium testaceum]